MSWGDSSDHACRRLLSFLASHSRCRAGVGCDCLRPLKCDSASWIAGEGGPRRQSSVLDAERRRLDRGRTTPSPQRRCQSQHQLTFDGRPRVIVTNNRRAPGGLLVLHARALPDNPYDGHTLWDVIDRTETLTGCTIERAYVDKGYRGNDAQNPVASSSPARSAASSGSSSVSCAAAPPLSPSSDT
jgi:hypothetical protein